jgi:hypothetical protein
LLGSEAAFAQSFEVGELYLQSRALPSVGQGVLRIDPSTGADSLLVDLSAMAPLHATLSWDPFRNRLVTAVSITIGGLVAIDAAGAATFPAPTAETPILVAARGDGLLYLRTLGGSLHFLDAADVAHDLLDVSGTAPYSLTLDAHAMIFDLSTNSILLFRRSGSTTALCPTVETTCAVKIPLVPDGTQVAGAESSVELDVSSTFEHPSGLSYGPGGDLMLVVDTNSNAQEPRMQLLDPVGMSFSVWASNGSYVGAAATNAGTYSGVRDEAVILDTGANSLRAFPLGGSGLGIVFGSDLSGTGSGELAQLIEIHTPPLSIPTIPTLRWPGLAMLAAVLVASAVWSANRRES